MITANFLQVTLLYQGGCTRAPPNLQLSISVILLLSDSVRPYDFNNYNKLINVCYIYAM